MLRIGQVEATATQDGKYTDGSVAGGIAATRLRAAAFNAMQEELAHIVESAGLALDINDMTQVLKAIQKLTLSRANPFADIKSDGAAAISTALTNLGLTDSTYGLKNYINISAVGVTNWEVPDVLKNGRKAFVRVIGAGGGGAIGNLSSTSGGGGGIAEGLVDLTGIATVSITVGQGGSAATTISSNGGSGGSSSFGTYMSATGGSGGGQPSGGPSGVGVGATNISSLGPGSPGAVIDSTNSALLQSIPGGSGGGPGGYGASATTSTNIAADAVAPGGGGAGLKPTLSTGVRAGKGANGIVIIYW
ncbi:hypothetical protein MXL19_07770 [Escherichia coli]|nr:hypothetical protein [Escherichia coli]